jgi:hypothetical protein
MGSETSRNKKCCRRKKKQKKIMKDREQTQMHKYKTLVQTQTLETLK